VRVLIVDDHPDTVEITSELMTSWGHECRTASYAMAALAAVDAFEPELALLDIDLPDLNGCDLLHELSIRFTERLPYFVAITGWPDACRDLLAAGFDCCLVKPVRLEQLLELVELARSRLNAQ
jgi:DNA-binding response OmpR family regulator